MSDLCDCGLTKQKAEFSYCLTCWHSFGKQEKSKRLENSYSHHDYGVCEHDTEWLQESGH